MASNQTQRPPASERKTLYIAFRCGRLANRLVLFANWMAFAEEHCYRLINFTFHSYSDMFETTKCDFYCQYPVSNSRSLWDAVTPVGRLLRRLRIPYHLVRNASRLNERFPLFWKTVLTLRETPGLPVTWLDDPKLLLQINRARYVFVYGWTFRSPELVRRHAEKIRAYFLPGAGIATASRKAVETLRQQAEIVIGVHIRHGDYKNWKRGQYYFDIHQYAEWMHSLVRELTGRRVAFLVCSDEARCPEEFIGLRVEFGPGTPTGDLYALAECDYIFGPLSTFSQWASFYGNKPLLQMRNKDAEVNLNDFRVSYLEEIP